MKTPAIDLLILAIDREGALAAALDRYPRLCLDRLQGLGDLLIDAAYQLGRVAAAGFGENGGAHHVIGCRAAGIGGQVDGSAGTGGRTQQVDEQGEIGFVYGAQFSVAWRCNSPTMRSQCAIWRSAMVLKVK